LIKSSQGFAILNFRLNPIVHKGFGYAITAQSKSFFVFLDPQFHCKKLQKLLQKDEKE
jgi:hypothetical protein